MQMRDRHSRFDVETHERMITMVAAGNVAEIRATGELWRQTARSLAERSDELTRQLESFSETWTGTAAAQYKAMVVELADGIDEVAGVVGLTRDLTFSAAECLSQAQAKMPDLVPIPTLSPQANAFATASDPHAWGALSEGQQAGLTEAWQSMTPDQQQRVAGEIRSYEQAVVDADSARGRAVQVMNELASQYAVLQEALPELPRLAHAPVLPSSAEQALSVVDHLESGEWPVADASTDGEESTAMVDPETGRALDWSSWTQVPVDASHALFGDVYAVGSIAASAAVLGAGGLGLAWIAGRRAREDQEEAAAGGNVPWIGGVVPPPYDGGPGLPFPPGPDPGGPASPWGDGTWDQGDEPPTDDDGTTDERPPLGGLGGAALGGAALAAGLKGGIPDLGGVGGGLGGPADVRAANPVLTGGTAAPGAAESRMLSTLNGGAAASRGAMPMGGMMPMMPMTGGADGGVGSGRKAPWLLEREPVFGGESVPVIPPVIGGAEPPESPRGRRQG